MNFNPRTPDGVRRYNRDYIGDDLSYFNPRTPDGVRLLF